MHVESEPVGGSESLWEDLWIHLVKDDHYWTDDLTVTADLTLDSINALILLLTFISTFTFLLLNLIIRGGLVTNA